MTLADAEATNALVDELAEVHLEQERVVESQPPDSGRVELRHEIHKTVRAITFAIVVATAAIVGATAALTGGTPLLSDRVVVAASSS